MSEQSNAAPDGASRNLSTRLHWWILATGWAAMALAALALRCFEKRMIFYL